MSLLLRWGLRPYHQAPDGLAVARVTRSSSGIYFILTANGICEAQLAGRLEYAAASALDLPVTGDWVGVTPTDPALIVTVLPRANCFTRATAGGPQPLAANVDLALLVMGLDGDFNPRRLERYLLLCREHGVAAAVILNKRDLCREAGARAEEVRSLAPGLPVLVLSALADDVSEALAPLLPTAQTAVLLGSSGAGKSTLLNRLCGAALQTTAPVRAGDSRGRHATTSRELFLTPHGFLLLDVPGLRAVGVAAGDDAVASTFADVAEAAQRCRFGDCTHSGEPGCAVAGTIDEKRLAAFHKLRREAAYEMRRQNPEAARAEKEKWKRIHREMRRHPKQP